MHKLMGGEKLQSKSFAEVFHILVFGEINELIKLLSPYLHTSNKNKLLVIGKNVGLCLYMSPNSYMKIFQKFTFFVSHSK